MPKIPKSNVPRRPPIKVNKTTFIYIQRKKWNGEFPSLFNLLDSDGNNLIDGNGFNLLVEH